MVCLTREQLHQLLDDGDDQDMLVDHVGQCESCRQALLNLSEDADEAVPWQEYESMLQTAGLSWPTLADPTSHDEEVWPEISGYEIIDVLGAGGMGIVFKARHRELGRIVALKMMRAQWRNDPQFRQRFRREAHSLAKLKHPNLVQIHDIFEHDGSPVLALEFVDGISLSQALRRRTLPPRDAAAILLDAATAAQAVHDMGLIHRDIKPANILLQFANGVEHDPLADAPLGDYTVKIADFGLARPENTAGDTQSGMVIGTPNYMAPEQAQGQTSELSPATDVYALGAVLYEMLAGRPPFCGQSTFDTIMQVIGQPPLPPSRIASSTPRDLETICLKCLNKQPGQRYVDCAALADDLQRFLDGRPIRARRQPWWVHAAKWARRHPWVAFSGGTAVAAVVVLLVVWAKFTNDLQTINGQLVRQTTLAKQRELEADAAREEAEKNAQSADRSSVKARKAQIEAQQGLAELSKLLTDNAELLRDSAELNSPSLRPLRQRLIRQTIAGYTDFLTRLENTPAMVDETTIALHRFASLMRNLGEDAKASDYCERAIALRRELRKQRDGRYSDDATLAVMLIDCANIWMEQNQIEQSAAALAEAEAILSSEDLTPPMSPAARSYRLSIAYYLSGQLAARDDLATARMEFLRAVATIAPALEQSSDEAVSVEDRFHYFMMAAEIHRKLGKTYTDADEFDKATAAYRESLELEQRAAELMPDNSKSKNNVAYSHCYLASAYQKSGKLDLALDHLRQAAEIRKRLIEQNPQLPLHSYELNMIHIVQGNIYRRREDYQQAASCYGAAIERLLRAAEEDSLQKNNAFLLARTLVDLVETEAAGGNSPPHALVEQGLRHLAAWEQPETPLAPLIAKLRTVQAESR